MDNQEELPRILVVGGSRVTRSTLIKHLRESYDIREETDGEAAWQVLMLDYSIELVICSMLLPVLDGEGLLKRMRASRLARLDQMPVLMISSDDDEEAIERAKSLGASDFVSRGTGGAELLARVDSLLKLSRAQNQLKENIEQHVQNPETGIFTRKYIEQRALQALSHAMHQGNEVSAIVMGFDNVGALREEYGPQILKQLQKRFISILSGKIRKKDSLGHFIGSQLVVISPGTSYSACEAFGNRLREAIRIANISVQGHRLNLSVSVGISNSPADGVSSAHALIELAGIRLNTAQQSGGDRIVSCDAKVSAPLPPPTLERAISFLRSGKEELVTPFLPELGGKLLPLLKLMERELALGLPLENIRKRLLAMRPKSSNSTGKTAGRADKLVKHIDQ